MKSTTVVRPSFRKREGQNDQSISTELRIEGDSLLENGKLYEALELYNKSLCVTQPNSHDIPLAYERRSVVYFEAEEYRLCLDNIKLARDNGYTACDGIETLQSLEEKCEKLMESNQQNVDDEPCNFFKLTYPPNEKIPFIVDCIELHNNNKYGRFIITTQDLYPGDIIAIEKPIFKTVNYESAHTRCTNCLKSNKLSLIPSPISQSAMFCSNECMNEASKTFFHVENDLKMHDIKQRMLFEALAICGGSFDKLKQLMDDTDLSKKTIFDFDLSDIDDSLYNYNQLMAVTSLSQADTASNEVVTSLSHHPVLKSIEREIDKEIAKRFLLLCFRILTHNTFGIEWVVPARPLDSNKDTIVTKLIGDCLCTFGSLINHSCSPNIDRVFVDNKLVFFVRRPIQKGYQLFISYGPLFLDIPREEREDYLKTEYGFKCCCEACIGDFPTSSIHPWTGIPIVINAFSNVADWKKALKKNCRKIIKNQKILSHSEMCIIMLRNLYYMTAIAKTEPFIFG